MIDIKIINNMDEVLAIIADQPQDENGRYRGRYLYRGLPNAEYNLLTSLQRNCGTKSNILEKALLNNFAKYTAVDAEANNKSIWRRMILGQHHGLPTRLLDWTHSPLVGLNFATSDADWSNLDKNDCVLWRIDIMDLHKRLPEEFQQIMKKEGANVFSVDMLNSVTNSIEKYDQITEGKSMVVMEPPSIDPRIVNQYAFFSVVPGQVSSVENFLNNYTDYTVKYIISKDLKWRIRDFLDEANISERTIYPGLDGICKWLARHYYVRNDKTDSEM